MADSTADIFCAANITASPSTTVVSVSSVGDGAGPVAPGVLQDTSSVPLSVPAFSLSSSSVDGGPVSTSALLQHYVVEQVSVSLEDGKYSNFGIDQNQSIQQQQQHQRSSHDGDEFVSKAYSAPSTSAVLVIDVDLGAPATKTIASIDSGNDTGHGKGHGITGVTGSGHLTELTDRPGHMIGQECMSGQASEYLQHSGYGNERVHFTGHGSDQGQVAGHMAESSSYLINPADLGRHFDAVNDPMSRLAGISYLGDGVADSVVHLTEYSQGDCLSSQTSGPSVPLAENEITYLTSGCNGENANLFPLGSVTTLSPISLPTLSSPITLSQQQQPVTTLATTPLTPSSTGVISVCGTHIVGTDPVGVSRSATVSNAERLGGGPPTPTPLNTPSTSSYSSTLLPTKLATSGGSARRSTTLVAPSLTINTAPKQTSTNTANIVLPSATTTADSCSSHHQQQLPSYTHSRRVAGLRPFSQQLVEEVCAKSCRVAGCRFLALSTDAVLDHIVTAHWHDTDASTATAGFNLDRAKHNDALVGGVFVRCVEDLHGRVRLMPVSTSPAKTVVATSGRQALVGRTRQRPIAIRSAPFAATIEGSSVETQVTPSIVPPDQVVAVAPKAGTILSSGTVSPTAIHSDAVILAKRRGRPPGSRSLGLTSLTRTPSMAEQRLMGLLTCSRPHCGVKLRHDALMTLHEQCHLGDRHSDATTSVGFRCYVCEWPSQRWLAMALHLWRNHRVDVGLFRCHLCSYRTAHYARLISQHLPTHGQQRSIACRQCGARFKNAKQLLNHQRRRHPSKPPTTTTTTPSTVPVPAGAAPKPQPRLRCPVCARLFSGRTSLLLHVRRHETPAGSGVAAPLACDHCPYTTTDHNTLRRHRMRHSGERPYRCPHCSYACIQASTYKRHVRLKHAALATSLLHSCGRCEFRTVNAAALRRHILSAHPDEDPDPGQTVVASCTQ